MAFFVCAFCVITLSTASGVDPCGPATASLRVIFCSCKYVQDFVVSATIRDLL